MNLIYSLKIKKSPTDLALAQFDLRWTRIKADECLDLIVTFLTMWVHLVQWRNGL